MGKIIYRAEFGKMLKNDFIRPIPNYESYYASRDGDILSTKSYMSNGKVRRLSPYVIKSGYHQETVNNYVKRVHQLVALAFLPNPNRFPIINHKDENPSNNHVENLEWCTYKYNSNYGTCKESKSKKVAQINAEGNTVKVWNSIWDAAKNGYTRCLVSDCANGKIPLYKKCKWVFV